LRAQDRPRRDADRARRRREAAAPPRQIGSPHPGGSTDGSRREGDRVVEVQEGRARRQDRVPLLSRRQSRRRQHPLSEARPGGRQAERRERGRGARGDLVRHSRQRGEDPRRYPEGVRGALTRGGRDMAEVELTAAFSTIPAAEQDAIKRMLIETVDQLAREDGSFKRAKLVFTESDERCGLTAELDGVKREGVPLPIEIDQLEDAQTSAGARAQLKEALRLYFRRVQGK